MAYAQGDTIEDGHYNGFASDINNIWGTGSGNSGYGNGSDISSVSAGATVTATQWESLLSRLESIEHTKAHQVYHLVQLVLVIQLHI